jgi:hypothetical protein
MQGTFGTSAPRGKRRKYELLAMNLSEHSALRVEATKFLQENGIVWRICAIENPPDEAGCVTTSPGVCLCQDMLLGWTSRVVGLLCVIGPRQSLIFAQQTLHFPVIDPLFAARELLHGCYDALFSSEGQPLALHWRPQFQQQLRHLPGPQLPSFALRASVLKKIVDDECRGEDELPF